MKLLLCFALLFAITSSSMLDISDLTEMVSEKNASNDLTVFAESIFRHFGLEKPDQILRCFCKGNEKLLFQSFRTVAKLLKDSKERKSFSSHIDYYKLELINKALQSTYGCIMMTQDFTDFLNALEIKERDSEFFEMALYIYYQAFYPRLVDDIEPLVATFRAKDFSQAGDIFANLTDRMVKEIKSDKFPYLAFSAFSNGVATELRIDYPNDSIKCHNSDTAQTVLGFLYKLAVRVEQGGWQEAPLNTLNFWNEEGKAMLESIPQDVVDCNMKSHDFAVLSDRLGIRVESKDFAEAMKKFVTKRRLSYFSYMKGLRSSMDDHNFIHAGYTWGHFLDSVSKSLPDEAKPEKVEA